MGGFAKNNNKTSYLGEHASITAVATAHPSPQEGSWAIQPVSGGNDIVMCWDNADGVWREETLPTPSQNLVIKPISEAWNYIEISDIDKLLVYNTSQLAYLVVPSNVHHAIPIGAKIHFLQIGDSEVRVFGVTVNVSDKLIIEANRYEIRTLIKISLNEYIIDGLSSPLERGATYHYNSNQDGIRKWFGVGFNYSATRPLAVYKNGLRLTKGIDYQEYVINNAINFTIAPISTDVLIFSN